MASFSEIANKKVAGIPVLYLAGGFVIVLAIVAWKMKPSVSPEEPTGDESTTPGNVPTDPGDVDYSGLATQGTVTVVQQQPAQTEPDIVVKTNQDWVREGAEWATANNKATGSVAYAALNKYVNGQDRSYTEQAVIDDVLKVKGQPPDAIAEGGNVGSKPVQKIPTLPGYHVVSGSSDNGYDKLAILYYGKSDQSNYDLIQAANVATLGRSGPFPIGTRVMVPKYRNPIYYNTPKDMTIEEIAAKNGIGWQAFRAYNQDDKTPWVIKKGRKVRVG